jgi:enoyl-CoA hydratase
VLSQIESCGKPVIALVNGVALGGGCELALACTLRVAAENAKLGLPEVKLGLIPGYGGTQRLARLVGRAATLRLILTGEFVTAVEALRIGLVNEVVPLEGLLARGREIAAMIAAVAPLAVTAALEAVQQGEERTLEAGLALEAEIFGRLCDTEDKVEGVAAFLGKRAAVWTGR